MGAAVAPIKSFTRNRVVPQRWWRIGGEQEGTVAMWDERAVAPITSFTRNRVVALRGNCSSTEMVMDWR